MAHSTIGVAPGLAQTILSGASARSPLASGSVSSEAVKWLSMRSLRLHATVLSVVAVCVALGYWQLFRALSGNTLSWVYTFEWPFFACYAIYMWWKLLHEDPSDRTQKRGRRKPQPSSEEEDAALAEYNRYLAELNAGDRAERN
jgi:hypothetical protein